MNHGSRFSGFDTPLVEVCSFAETRDSQTKNITSDLLSLLPMECSMYTHTILLIFLLGQSSVIWTLSSIYIRACACTYVEFGKKKSLLLCNVRMWEIRLYDFCSSILFYVPRYDVRCTFSIEFLQKPFRWELLKRRNDMLKLIFN